MIKETLDYITAIQNNKIVIVCEDEKKKVYLKSIGAKKPLFGGNRWFLHYLSEDDLSQMLMDLRDKNFMFVGGVYGWSPVDVFQHLKQKGMTFGSLSEIVWTSKNTSLIRKLD